MSLCQVVVTTSYLRYNIYGLASGMLIKAYKLEKINTLYNVHSISSWMVMNCFLYKEYKVFHGVDI